MVTLQLAASLVDLGSGRVRRLGTSATLSPLDLRLLRYLVARPGESLGRGELLGEVWSGEGSERAVDAAVRSLRVQVEVDPSRPDHIANAPQSRSWSPRGLSNRISEDLVVGLVGTSSVGSLWLARQDGAQDDHEV